MAGRLDELWKKGTSVPLTTDIPEGGIAIDVLGRAMYSKASGGDIFKIGISSADEISLGEVDNTSDADKPISNDTQIALNGKIDDSQVLTDVPANALFTDTVYDSSSVDSHIGNVTSNPHQVDKADVGLSSVDNTTDLNKPISTATQTALNAKATEADLTTAEGRISVNETDINTLDGDKEDVLGLPAGNDFVLVSDTLGNREWVDSTTRTVRSVNALLGTVILKTGDIDEGIGNASEPSNLYFTDTRADARVQVAIDDTSPSSSTIYSSQKVVELVEGGIIYKGLWDAETNIPTLSDGTGSNGDFYKCSVGFTQDLGSGPILWEVGDSVVHNGTIFEQIAGAPDKVQSVNGKVGQVTLSTDDVDEGAVNLYHTPTRVNALLSNVIDDNNTVGDYTWSSTKIDSEITTSIGNITYPVISVNGDSGAVVLSNSDVGAAATVHTHSISEVTGLQTELDSKMEQTDLDNALVIGLY
jgi:hypothetical protein